MAWFFQTIEAVIGLGLLGVGVTVLRRAHPLAGYMMTLAGLLQLTSVCCLAGVTIATDRERGDFGFTDEGMMTQGFSWLAASLVDLVGAILIVVALFLVAKNVKWARGGIV